MRCINYCTLFNSHYLSRGLALYGSLVKCAANFHLTIFVFDDISFEILHRLNLPYVTLVSLKDFETPELIRVKPTRTIAEYCWTCTSSVILHCLVKNKLEEVCYLDADLYFWQIPAILIQEAEKDSILITEHRYTPEYDNSEASGKYCVQFMYFKNNVEGLTALRWWRDACIKWCFNRVEPGLFGDQKYLDDWLERFQGVKVLSHLGGGVAPWNVQQYEKIKGFDRLVLRELSTDKEFNLVFYHFHALKFINQRIDLGHYKLKPWMVESIYRPYSEALLAVEHKLKQDHKIKTLIKSTNLHGHSRQKFNLKEWLRNLKKRTQGVYNALPIRDL